MALISSKLFALNLVDVSDSKTSTPAFDGTYERLASLESQLQALQQWKDTLSPTVKEMPDSPRSSVSSLDSTDLPALDSQLTSPRSSIPGVTPSPPKTIPNTIAPIVNAPVVDVTTRVLDIIQSYGQNEPNPSGEIWPGRAKFEPNVRKQIDAGEAVKISLPAFPWKSVNRVEKVLGAVPDLGEELALSRLNALCAEVKEVYEPGATVTLTSDGLVYSDILGIPEDDQYEFGAALRRMAKEKGLEHLKFVRVANLLGLTDNLDLTKEEYLAIVGPAREQLMARYLPENFDVQEAIKNDGDINLTFNNYVAFLSKDLRHSPVTQGITSKNEYTRCVKRVASDMIIRGKAFANILIDQHPDYIRLSIHRSTGQSKLAFPLIPQNNHFPHPPWHGCVAVMASGKIRTTHACEMREKFDVVEQNGRPYYFRDRDEVWQWEGVEFEILYPRGLVVRAKGQQRLGGEEKKRLERLGKGFSPVIALGFGN